MQPFFVHLYFKIFASRFGLAEERLMIAPPRREPAGFPHLIPSESPDSPVRVAARCPSLPSAGERPLARLDFLTLLHMQIQLMQPPALPPWCLLQPEAPKPDPPLPHSHP